MPLVLELGPIHDPPTRRAFEQILLQLPGLVTTTGGGGGAPTGPAGGALSGTYPNPGLASLVVVDGNVSATAAIAESKLSLATDAAAGVGSRRTLGTSATQAAAGNDARFTDARTPTAHHTTHEPGGTDAMAVDAVAATGSLRTLGTGAQQATAGNDSRLTNARTPTAHATTHQPGGSDAMAVDAAAATGSLRTLGTGAAQAAAGNDARFTDARTPTAHQSTHQSGNSDALTGNVDATARHNISKAGTLVGTRRELNLIEGANITMTVADNAGSERVDVTVAASTGGGSAPSLVSTLPGSPTTGQWVRYQNAAMATAKIEWLLVYTGTQWDFLGGGDFLHEIVTDESTTSGATMVDLTTVGPTLTVPLTGDYEVTFGFNCYVAVAAGQNMQGGLKIGAAATTIDISVGNPFSNGALSPTRTRKIAFTAGDVVKVQYASSTTTATHFRWRTLVLRPIRVG